MRFPEVRDIAQPSAAEMVECPICGSKMKLDAAECPECGEAFALEALDSEKKGVRRAARREQVLFWLGLVLIFAGGPGIFLGSWIHDWYRIPFVGNAFNEFGWINRLFAALGMLILVTGIILLILSLRLRDPYPEEDYDVGY